MANRHLSRSIVLQSLFEWDFNKNSEKIAGESLKRNIAEFASDSSDVDFMESLLKGILSHSEEIDDIISKAAPEWPISKISLVDRNVLRVGLYELILGDRKEVPPKVAINESIELAKAFGGENSGKFVNGVLGAVYKEMGEPGKNEGSKRKDDKVLDKDLPKEILGGAVVYARDKDDIYLALVHDVFGHWTLSKGKIDQGEDERVSTVRKIKEEIGLDIKIEEDLGSNQYVAYNPERGKIIKIVKYFLAQASFEDLKLGDSGGLDDAKWFKIKDILDLNFYDDIMPIVTKAIKMLVENK